MVWDPRALDATTLAEQFEIVTVPSDDAAAVRRLLEREWTLSESAWTELVDRVLPDGMFLARVRGSETPVGTVSVIHNPRGSRFYFPGGGAVAYLLVDAHYRGHRLGSALMTRALARLSAGGYRTVWVAVEASRLAAIVTYLDVGFVPFLHAPDAESLLARWLEVYDGIGRVASPEQWPRDLGVR